MLFTHVVSYEEGVEVGSQASSDHYRTAAPDSIWGHFDGTSICPGPAAATAPSGTQLGPQQWPSVGTGSALGTSQSPDTSSLTPAAPQARRATRSQTQTAAAAAAAAPATQTQPQVTGTVPPAQMPLPPSAPPTLTPPTAEEKKAQQDWDNNEALSQYLLSQRIPDSTLMNAAAMFGLQLPPGALQAMRTVDPDVLIHIVSDKSEREAKEHKKRTTNHDQKQNMNSKVKNKALTVQSHPRDTRTCYNCNRTGHIAKYCRLPHKDRNRQNVVNSNSESDWACFAQDRGEKHESEPDEAVNLCRHITCAPSFEDWLDEPHEYCGGKQEISIVTELASRVSDAPDFAGEPEERKVILDSGATKHLSLYKEDFVELRSIKPKPFETLNNLIHAVGIGTLVVNMPNGHAATRLNIENVHYAPGSPYTLLSTGSFDCSGFTYSGGNGTCTLSDSSGRRIALLKLAKNGVDYQTLLSSGEGDGVRPQRGVGGVKDRRGKKGSNSWLDLLDSLESDGVADYQESDGVVDCQEGDGAADSQESGGVADYQESDGVAECQEGDGAADSQDGG
ncbi:hypothetical protein ACEPAI_8320 [Sanghuangporus weigelae]